MTAEMKGNSMFTRYFTGRKYYLFAVLALAVLALAGCDNGTTTANTSVTTNGGSTNTSEAASPSSVITSAMAILKHAPEGTANLSWNHITHVLTIQTNLTGLAPSSNHPVAIYEGSCAKQGKVLYNLPKLQANAEGVVKSSTTIVVKEGIPAKGWSLSVANGPETTSADQSLSIVCADIVNAHTSLTGPQTLVVPLDKAPESSVGQNVTGTARLSITNHVLKLEMTLMGLQPNSQHMAHVHLGSCAAQGSVIYQLPVVKADSTGKATISATFPGVATIPARGWFINIHRSVDLSTQTGFDPIACGNILPCRPKNLSE